MLAPHRLALPLLFATLLAGPSIPAQATPGNTGPGACREFSIAVAASESGPPDHTIAATLCVPDAWAPGPRQVDVLVAGATYTRAYWDWPEQPETYSYVADTLAAGRATFAFDKLGTGTSSRPPSGVVTVPAHGYILHQLVTWLRAQDFAEVNAIGHSLGSVIIADEAARWHDLDRLVLTGSLHFPAIGSASGAYAAGLHPALADPGRAPRSPDIGYLTTVPGTRGAIFYDLSNADPAVIARDEEFKDSSTVGETLGSVYALQTPAPLNATRAITAPVLVVVGAEDGSFCGGSLDCATAGPVAANERPYFSGAADFDALTVPATGHSLTLHPSAPDTFRAIDRWLGTGDPN